MFRSTLYCNVFVNFHDLVRPHLADLAHDFLCYLKLIGFYDFRNEDTKPATEKAKADAQAAADKAEKCKLLLLSISCIVTTLVFLAVSKGKDLWISGLASNTRAAELKVKYYSWSFVRCYISDFF